MKLEHLPPSPSKYGVFTLVVVLSQTSALSLAADSPPTKPGPAIELSPFEVRTDRDQSYGALNSNSLTRFNTELNKVSVSADIFTQDFMRDVSVTSVEELLSQYGAGTGLASSNPESDASQNQPGDRLGNLQVGVRGLSAGSVRRDGFTSVGSLANPGSTAVGVTSTFDIERVELIRGPQGLLYGSGGAGGTINVVSKRAQFNRRAGNVTYRIDQYGSKQTVFDYNWGNDRIAFRLAVLDDDARYRRLYIGGKTSGYYGQLAVTLPFRTTLRLMAERTESDRINSTGLGQLKFDPALQDPRMNHSLTYLLATNQTGAINPVDGRAYPGGPIANGKVTWENLNSWAGWRSSEYVNNNIFTAGAETVLTKYLTTHVAALSNNYKSDRIFGGITGLTPPLSNNNPLAEWANGVSPRDTEQPTRRTAFRAAAVLETDLWRIKSQTLIGYDAEWIDIGPTDFGYYLADDRFNVKYDPAIPTNLGRTPIGTLWWPVGGGPVKYPFDRPGWYTPRLTVDGQNYVRVPGNPRDPAWVRANNPLGLASLAGNPGVSGQNGLGDVQKNSATGAYLTNYSSWFADRLTTILGWRQNQTRKKNPNSVATYSLPYSENNGESTSYNAGLNFRLNSIWRAYYGYSNTYQIPIVNANDPLGNPARPSTGSGHELGLKFATPDGRISGSVQYFWTNSVDEMTLAGAAARDLINPTGRNGAYIGPGGAKDQWVNLDRTSNGVEVILTASPTKNWRIRLSAANSDGTVLSNKQYPLLYNDQFHVANGAVTYADGSPFLIPIDDETIRNRVARLTGQIDPTSIQGAVWAPLTIAMINQVNGPYWAQPADDNGRITGSNLLRVLASFVKPSSGSALTGVAGRPISEIQYNWTDPFNSGGKTIVAKMGEKTVGYAQYRFSVTSMHSFGTDSWLKNFGIGGTVSAGFKNRSYYYTSPDRVRRLFAAPSMYQCNLIASYRVPLGKKYNWTTQVNISNLFNRYEVGVMPNGSSGYASTANLAATFFGQPRMLVWTNTFSF